MEQVIKQILNNENIQYNKITKATSGFTNFVYFIDDKYVIKMSKDELIKKKLEKETSIYKNIKMNCVPKYISSGMANGYKYLIISKVNGKGLYSIWHTLTNKERQNCVKQIAKILREFNNQNAEFLSDEYKNLNWKEFIETSINEKLSTLKEKGFKVENLISFIKKEFPQLFAENIFGLVYNDAHFDNFIYDNGQLNLIDFDRVKVCPIDYEMLIFKLMCINPLKFVSEEDEDKIKEEDYANIYDQFKLEYPEMFTNKNVEKRIAVYQFDYLIGQAIKCNNKEWANEIIKTFNFQMGLCETNKEKNQY